MKTKTPLMLLVMFFLTALLFADDCGVFVNRASHFGPSAQNLTTTGTVNVSVTSGSGSTGSGGNSQIPAAQGWFQVPNTKIRALCPSYPEIQANSGCAAVMSAWGGGFYDPESHQVIIHGGGHADYYGNEIYALNTDLNPMTVTLYKDASHGAAVSGIATSCPLAYADNTPSSRHPYAGEIHIDNLRKHLYWSGAKSGCGFFSNDMWYGDGLGPVANYWQELQPTNPTIGPNEPGEGSIPAIAYDPGDQTHAGAMYAYSTNDGFFLQFDAVNNKWILLANVGNPVNASCGGQTNFNVTIDKHRRFFYATCSGGHMAKWSLDPPYTATLLNATGCSALSANSPGLADYTVNWTLVMYAGGNTAYEYNPDTDSCTPRTFSGGPTTVQVNGTFGRFQYIPKSGVFAYVGDIDSNFYTLRLDTVATQQATDRAHQCSAPGVILCKEWDTASEFVPVDSTHGVQPNGLGQKPTVDLTTFTSGGGSMRCAVPAKNDGNACGSFFVPFGQNFGNGTEFNIQYRMRVSNQVLNQHPKTDTGAVTFFKHEITAAVVNGSAVTCAGVELTTVDLNDLGFPGMYSHCGSDGFEPPINGADFLLEQGHDCKAAYGTPICTAPLDTGYNAHYQAGVNDIRSRAFYPPDEWVTYTYRVRIGHFGSADSTIEAWVSKVGEPMRQFINMPNHNLSLDAGNTVGYNFIDFLNYYTNRDGNTAFGQDGVVWWDGLTISTQPIANPAAPVT